MKKQYLALTPVMASVVMMGIVLVSSTVKADNNSIVDEINITVPVACTLGGTGMDTHNATINNGQYNSAVGETTMKAFCNDNNGFSIYAIGYTDNTDGKNVLTNTTLGSTYDIETGTLTTGADSQWAMKLSTVTDPTPTYPIIIAGSTDDTDKEQGDPDFTDFQEVPDDYIKVAYRKAGTDIGTGAEGATLKSTYQAYISPTQPAGTYTGQVKYTMVHPYNAAEPVLPNKVGVTYHANGSTFSGGATTNRVVYSSASDSMYIATTPLIAKSSNVANDGTKTTAYASDANDLVPIMATGASKMKVVINYGVASGTGLVIMEGNWDGQSEPPSEYEMISDGDQNVSGTGTYVFDGDSITMYMMDFDNITPVADYDYGFWAQVYPVYTTEQSGTESTIEYGMITTVSVDTGTYAQTTDWRGSWYADINNQHYDFMDESELTTFLGDNLVTLSGTNIDLYRGLTFTEAYNRASKTQDGGYYKQQDLNNSICQTVAITQSQIVKDIRDSNTYMIGKLKDGKCWMLDNLALDPTNATTAANMNASNTNASAEAITNYLNGGSSMVGWSNVAVVNKTSGWNINYPNEPLTQPYINNQSKNTLVTSYGSASISGQAKVGIYYNYCAVTVGTYCYETNTDIDIPDTNIDAPQDICPVNWRMPTGGANGEYAALYNKYNTTQDATNTASLQYALSTPLSGRFYNNSANYQNSDGFWWSSSYHYSGSVYLLETDPTNTNPYYDYSRFYGFTVRCLVAN